ncbi:hypothetical protein J6590_016674 [Homalodisca vitripennis]|nr:hypothetical protein J6590_016674 [Homalodisca vitripennis]
MTEEPIMAQDSLSLSSDKGGKSFWSSDVNQTATNQTSFGQKNFTKPNESDPHHSDGGGGWAAAGSRFDSRHRKSPVDVPRLTHNFRSRLPHGVGDATSSPLVSADQLVCIMNTDDADRLTPRKSFRSYRRQCNK